MIPGAVAAFAVTPPGAGSEVCRAPPRRRRDHPAPSRRPSTAAAALEAERSPRWVWWSAEDAAAPLVDAGVPVARAWDVAEAHRLLHGGWSATAGQCWAAAHGIPLERVPAPPTGDLFEFVVRTRGRPAADALLDADGHLRGDHEEWLREPAHLEAWARAALETAAPAARRRGGDLGAARRHGALRVGGGGAVPRAATGRPADRPGAHRGARRRRRRAATRPRMPTRLASRRARDALVLRHAPGRESTDLRNPAQVRELLTAVGVDVPNTRKWVLEPYRTVAPARRRPARLAARRADRHDVRLPVARRATSAPTTGCAGGGRPATARPAG